MDVVEILGKIGFDSKVFLFNLANFIILALLLKKFLFDKMSDIMEERQQTIEDGIAKFEKSEAHMQQAKEEKVKILKDAENEGNKIIKESVKEAEVASGEVYTKSKKVLEESKTANAKQLKRQKEQMLQEFKEEAASYLVTEMKEKI